MNQKERMCAGLPYKAGLDGLPESRLACKELLYEYNHLAPREMEKARALLKSLFGQNRPAALD